MEPWTFLLRSSGAEPHVGELENPVNMGPHTSHLILSKQFERVNTEYTTNPGGLWPQGNPAENSVWLLSFDQWP